MLSSKVKSSFNLSYLIALTKMGAVLAQCNSTIGMFERKPIRNLYSPITQ